MCVTIPSRELLSRPAVPLKAINTLHLTIQPVLHATPIRLAPPIVCGAPVPLHHKAALCLRAQHPQHLQCKQHTRQIQDAKLQYTDSTQAIILFTYPPLLWYPYL